MWIYNVNEYVINHVNKVSVLPFIKHYSEVERRQGALHVTVTCDLVNVSIGYKISAGFGFKTFW